MKFWIIEGGLLLLNIKNQLIGKQKPYDQSDIVHEESNEPDYSSIDTIYETTLSNNHDITKKLAKFNETFKSTPIKLKVEALKELSQYLYQNDMFFYYFELGILQFLFQELE